MFSLIHIKILAGFTLVYGQGIFLFAEMSGPALRPTHLPFKLVLGLFTMGKEARA